MAVSWNTRELPPEQDLRAMALLQISDEGLSEDEWRDEIGKYRQAYEAEAGGLASIEDKQQYVLGLCFYDIRDDVRCGKVLEIRRAVIPDTVAPLIARDFVSIIENLARTRNCGSIHVAEDVGHRFRANAMQSLLESEFLLCHRIGVTNYRLRLRQFRTPQVTPIGSGLIRPARLQMHQFRVGRRLARPPACG